MLQQMEAVTWNNLSALFGESKWHLNTRVTRVTRKRCRKVKYRLTRWFPQCRICGLAGSIFLGKSLFRCNEYSATNRKQRVATSYTANYRKFHCLVESAIHLCKFSLRFTSRDRSGEWFRYAEKSIPWNVILWGNKRFRFRCRRQKDTTDTEC